MNHYIKGKLNTIKRTVSILIIIIIGASGSKNVQHNEKKN